VSRKQALIAVAVLGTIALVVARLAMAPGTAEHPSRDVALAQRAARARLGATPPTTSRGCHASAIRAITGASWTFEVVGPGSLRGRLDVQVVSVRHGAAGDVLTIRAGTTGASPRREVTVERTCDDVVGVEDPWFLPAYMAVGAMRPRERLWRWPRELAPDAIVAGRVELGDSEPRMTLERRGVVREREHITTRAGAFDAWRVEVSEEGSFGARSLRQSGTLWLADGVGMVRSTLGDGDARQSLELVALSP